MSTSDAIAIAAGCVGAGLTLFALAIAVACFFGYSTIRTLAAETAERVAREAVTKLLLADGEMSAKLKKELEKHIESAADRLYEDISMSTAFPRDAASGSIAESYPKEGGSHG